MPNSLNYGKPLTNTLFQRPSRITPADLKLLRMGQAPVVFGTTIRDLVELWIYNPDGSIAAHVNIGPTDEVLRQATFVDQTGGYETININLREVVTELDVQPGRYAMVANFFRNEIGSEGGNNLFIADISDDRTELRLEPIEVTDDIINDIFEFIVPSVPKQYAKGLIDQAFAVPIDAPPVDEISSSKVEVEIEAITQGTMDRVGYAQANQEYLNLYATILSRTYVQALDNMASDVFNYNVQQIELESYITTALSAVVYDIVQRGEADPRFLLT
jgi:hypothetical protein